MSTGDAKKYAAEARAEFEREVRRVSSASVERLLCAVEALVADAEERDARIATPTLAQRVAAPGFAEGVAAARARLDAADASRAVTRAEALREVASTAETGTAMLGQRGAEWLASRLRERAEKEERDGE